MQRTTLSLLVSLPLLAAACSSPQPGGDAVTSPSSAPAPGAVTPPGGAASGDAPAADPVAAPPASASVPSADPSAAPATSASAAPAAEPAPAVEVKNIGMHVGGGVNDAAEKAPIKRSVEPHMTDFAKCFAKVDVPTKGGDFGVDLRIERDGGRAKVSHPRTSLKGDGFRECVLGVFESIEFERPKGGTTTVSYSLRFTPKNEP